MSASCTIEGERFEHTGPAPYKARSASDHDKPWPFWIVVDAVGFNGVIKVGSTAKLFTRDRAVQIAAALNEAAAK